MRGTFTFCFLCISQLQDISGKRDKVSDGVGKFSEGISLYDIGRK